MKIIRVPKNSLPSMITLLLGALVCASSIMAQNQEWRRSDRRDGIETFYQSEKVGTDRFVVKVKVKNNRPKSVRVVVQVQYRDELRDRLRRRGLFYPQGSAYVNNCVLIIPSGGSRFCDDVTVTTTKITGVKIMRWDYVE